MRKNLKMLDELQEIDLKIDSIKDAKEALLTEIATLERNVAEAESGIALKAAELSALEDERKGLEETLATEAENIVRSEGRLKEIKTQKEYQAVSKEISTAKKLKTELEEQVLQKVSLAEELKGEIATREENLHALQQNVASQKGELQAKVDSIEADMAAQTATRDTVAKGLPASVVRRYGIVRQQRKGLAVVEARDGYCLGCNMNLPPQLYNSLFRGDELITCPHCQRMLVLRQEEKAS